MKHTDNQSQSGAVSIFVVLFAALFITIITVSFVGIMLKNQIHSINADLADSAYDSSLAGVEDAKRAIQLCLSPAGAGISACARLMDGSGAGDCNLIKQILYGKADTDKTETPIQRREGADQALDQAYTCVKIRPNVSTLELPKLAQGVPTVIPIDTTAPYDELLIQWREQDYTGNPGCRDSSATKLPVFSDWTQRAACYAIQSSPNGEVPPLLKVQFVKLDDGASFSLQDFNSNPGPRSRTAAASLYPTRSAAAIAPVSLLSGNTSFSRPVSVRCTSGLKQCSKRLIGDTIGTERPSYLIITPVYTAADVWISPTSSGTPVNFSSMFQVDATGRANDLFRRVNAQIKIANYASSSSDKFPTATLELDRLCKSFSVTNDTADFSAADPDNCI